MTEYKRVTVRVPEDDPILNKIRESSKKEFNIRDIRNDTIELDEKLKSDHFRLSIEDLVTRWYKNYDNIEMNHIEIDAVDPSKDTIVGRLYYYMDNSS